ncbi:ArsR family transcriptional regulator [Kribbella amoyensis]|uniref:ArsR family transcriptional regulator n=1 Tax=Kribbella amoyensis TaxID=996641 RepID=A0A561BSK1_9ACTN|nr:helix-turn-helix domain-containing protein [Kribbella amoyensis]TWD81888.1 ArsR family transcriptional regulator [Kribbella amoyensis]
MSLESDPPESRRKRLLDDPLAIRALAHPVRLDLQALLGKHGPLTAADAARRLGISQALASHHLRQLAKYDFVEPAPGRDNRERPWRLVSTSQSWRSAHATPEGAAAADILEQLIAERALNNLADWQQRRSSEDDVWMDNAGIDQTGIYLTGEELAELEDQISGLLRRYVDERPIDDKSTRPPGSRRVDIVRIVTVSPADEDDDPAEDEQ